MELAHAPSRPDADCSQLVSTALRLICATPSLEAADEAVSDLYRRVVERSSPPEGDSVREAQRRFADEQRASCSDVPCLEAVYKQRLAELRTQAEAAP